MTEKKKIKVTNLCDPKIKRVVQELMEFQSSHRNPKDIINLSSPSICNNSTKNSKEDNNEIEMHLIRSPSKMQKDVKVTYFLEEEDDGWKK